MEKKTYRIAPYEKEYWDWLLYAGMTTFMCWCFCSNVELELPGWGYGVIFALACLGFGLARIRQRGVELFLSADGIRVCNGGQETVLLTPWSAFECGYIVTIYSYSRSGRDMDTYFLLTGKPLDKDTLDRAAFDLLATKPCGIWKDYIAIKTSKYDNKTIQTAIGDHLPVKGFVYDMDDYEETEE